MSVLDRLGVLADPTRCRLLLALDRHELAVSELCAVLQLPQSTVSRHLKVLADDGWVSARADGTSRHYALAASIDPAARRLWQLVRGQIAEDLTAAQDGERLRSVLAERRSRSQEFFARSAGQWDALRDELFGARSEFLALPGLLDESWVVGDLGCGTGELTATLAPFVARVIAVDQSRAMLAAARTRLKDHPNVELRHGDLEGLPIADGELDAAVLLLVLPYVTDPAQAIAEAGRALKSEGRLLIVDLRPHAREDYRQTMGHLWQGFSEEQINGWLARAELEALRYRALPPDPRAKGPALFCATARRTARSARGAVRPAGGGAQFEHQKRDSHLRIRG